jgi:hypothetical protein
MRIRFRVNVFTEPLPSSGRLFLIIEICCLAANVVSLFGWRSLPRNGSTRHNIWRQRDGDVIYWEIQQCYGNKVKFLCLIHKIPCHEDRIAPPFLTLVLDGGGVAQLLGSAALHKRKEPPVPIPQGAGWVPQPISKL